MRERLRRLLETVVPWYDSASAAERDKSAAEARLSAQRLRADYLAYARRLERRR